jgi:hypothetical protein
VPKRREPVDTDYAVFSKFFKDVGSEMSKPRHFEGRSHG